MNSKLFILLLFLNSCQPKSNSDINRDATPTLKTEHNGIFDKNENCTLAVDTFSFKGITLGANIKTLKNIRKQKSPITIYHSNVFTPALSLPREIKISEEEIDNSSEVTKYAVRKGLCSKLPPETTYEIIDADKLTIFSTPVNKIYLRFYADTLYQIIIFPKSSIVNNIASKFNGQKCLENKSNFDMIDLSNKKLRIYSESCRTELDNKVSNEWDYSYLIVTNEIQRKRKFSKLNNIDIKDINNINDF